MTSAIQNIIAGVTAQAEARKQAERKADVINEQEIAAAGVPPATAEDEQVHELKELTTAEMNQAIQLLSAAVMDLNTKLGNGELK